MDSIFRFRRQLVHPAAPCREVTLLHLRPLLSKTGPLLLSAEILVLVLCVLTPYLVPTLRAQTQGAEPIVASGGGVEMRVGFGYGGRFRAGYWTPLRIVLTRSLSGGPDEVVLSVSVRHGSPLAALSHTTTYERTLKLPAGTSLHTEFYPLLSNAFHPLHIELRNREGQLLATTTLDLARRVAPEGLIVALDPSSQGWSWLTQHLTALTPIRGQLSGLTLAYIDRPQSLPSSWLGYHGVTAVAVSGAFPLHALSEAQAQALADWVAAGGTLIVAGGPDIGAMHAPRAIAEIQAGFGLSGFTRRLSSAASPTRYPPFPGEADLILWEIMPQGASVLSRASDAPLVAQAAYGKGTAFLLTFDPAALNRLGWQGLGDVARDVLRNARPLASGLHSAESAVWRFIRSAPLPLPNRWVPGLVAIGYIVILALILWWINRKGPRPVRAGLALTAVVSLFTLASAKLLGPISESVQHGAAELMVSMADPTGHGMCWRFQGLRSESVSTWQVRQTASGWTQAPTQLISMEASDPDLTIVQLEPGLSEAQLPARTVGRFIALEPTKLALYTHLALREANYTLTVRNDLAYGIDHLYYVHPSLFAYLGPLPPGGTVEYVYPAGVHSMSRPSAEWMGTAVRNDLERHSGGGQPAQLLDLFGALIVQRLQAGPGERPLDDGFVIGLVEGASEPSLTPRAATHATHVVLFDVALTDSSAEEVAPSTR